MQLTNENFIGRTEEVSQFIHWLEDTSGSLIFYLHDALGDPAKKGGIGKTWLLRRFVSLFKEQAELRERFIPVVIDLFDVAGRDGVVIAERIVQALREIYPHWSPQGFEKVLRQYHETLQQKKGDAAGILNRLGDALSNDLRLLHERMVEMDRYILLLFDTFELIENNPITAVLHTSHTFPDTYNFERIRVVVAGRNELHMKHQNWIGREQDILSVALTPFSYQETLQYLDYYDASLREDLSEEMLQALYQKAEGRPILLGLVTDVLDRSEKSLEELVAIKQASFEESLVTQINNFEDPVKWAIFCMAHVYHRFDLDFLHLIMSNPGLDRYIPQDKYQELTRTLPNLSFVRHSSSSKNFVLHDEMRRLVNKYCWEKQDPDESIRRELSKLAIRYYEQVMEREEYEETQQSYSVEILFHHLIIHKDEGFQFFEQNFQRAINLSSRAFARSLLQEVQKFRERFSPGQLRILQLDEARLLREEENYKDALVIYETLELDNEWFELHHSDLLYEKGPCYLRLGQYDQAIACFKANMEIEQSNPDQARYVTLLSRLGYAYRLQGRYTEALKFYREAQRHQDDPLQYAELLNNIGNVYRLQGGRLEEALSSCKQALHIRRDLFKRGKISEAYIALSQNTLGHIYHTLGELDDEEKAYREAFDIYSRLGNRSAIADTHNNVGRMLVKRGKLEDAVVEFQQASRIAAGENHIAEIESCNQQGRVCLTREKYIEAKSFFERAIELSRQFNLRFQQAENLLYLAEVLDHLDLPSEEQVKEAKRIARRNDYSYLLARAGDVQGDMYFRKREYQSAFRYYRISCRYMTQRGSPEFDKEIRKLNDQLLVVPVGFLPGIIDSLLSYWYELGLDEKYPQLPRVCREVSRNIFL
jgi:tetratricopeptide (TPR) repeat protein